LPRAHAPAIIDGHAEGHDYYRRHHYYLWQQPVGLAIITNEPPEPCRLAGFFVWQMMSG
jgi:hypothetical protein